MRKKIKLQCPLIKLAEPWPQIFLNGLQHRVPTQGSSTSHSWSDATLLWENMIGVEILTVLADAAEVTQAMAEEVPTLIVLLYGQHWCQPFGLLQIQLCQ